MQQQMTRLTGGGYLTLLILPLLLGIISPNVLAKGPSAIKADKEEVQRYLHGKYKIKEILIEEQEDTYSGLGRRRSLSLGGETFDNDITPPTIAAQGDRATKDMRTIARAFLAEESDLLELTSISEMREIVRGLPATADEKGISLGYEHYLNGLRLDGTQTGISIGPSGKIEHATVRVVDITPPLLEAVKNPGLPQTEIRRAIKKDLIANGLDPDKVTHIEDEQYAIPLPPYVVWETRINGEGLEYALTYVIDAFTGQTLRKQSSLQY